MNDSDFYFYLRSLENYCFMQKYKKDCNYNDIVRYMLFMRCKKLNNKFKWTEQNIQKLLEVNKIFTEAWEGAFIEAKTIMNTLYKRVNSNDKYLKDYGVQIELQPYINVWDDEVKAYIQTMSVIDKILRENRSFDIKMWINNKYYPETGDDNKFFNDKHINRNQNWKTKHFNDEILSEYNICYAMDLLCDNTWAFEDILRINHIDIKINVIYRSFKETICMEL